MDTQAAMEILCTYRASGADADDPDFAEALALLERDPDLRAWFEGAQSFDRAFAQKLNALDPPPALRGRILSREPAYRSESEGEGESEGERGRGDGREDGVARGGERNPGWWRQPAPLAAAACVAITAAVAAHLLFGQPSGGGGEGSGVTGVEPQPLKQFVAAIENHAQTYDFKGHHYGDIHAVKAFLTERGSPVPQRLPVSLRTLAGTGCVALKVRGVPVSMVCFRGKKTFHLYIADKRWIAGSEELARPAVRQFGQRAAAAWSEGTQFFMVVVKGTAEDVKTLL